MSFKCDRCGGEKFKVTHTYRRFAVLTMYSETTKLTRFPSDNDLSWWNSDSLEHDYIATCCYCVNKWASHTTLDDLKEEMEDAGVLT